VPKNQLQRIDRTSSPAHQGKLRNAIDFIVDEETPVLAAAQARLKFFPSVGFSLYSSIYHQCNFLFTLCQVFLLASL
jgi:hypothetical protein